MSTPNLKTGFTLIELMVTVAILGIIAGLAIPAYNGYITTAKMTEAHNNLAALRLAQEENYLETNSYFTGTDTNDLENNSNGLWTAAKGSDGLVNFNYVVSSAGGWTATATGNRVGTSIFGKSVSAFK